MMAKKKDSSSVKIGNVKGGIKNANIAGGDINITEIMIDGKPVKVDEEPSIDQFKELLAEIQAEMAKVVLLESELKAIAPGTPTTAKAVEEKIEFASKKAEENLDQDTAENLQDSISDATSWLTNILDGAKRVATKAGEVGEAAKPIVEMLEPIVTNLGVAALWAQKLWMLG
jgi:hypothetical protein